MAFTFGDGFDCYAASADAVNGYWDSSAVVWNLVAGRFSGSLGLLSSGTSPTLAVLQKASGSNDAVHHIAFSTTQAGAITGSSNGAWFTFMDGATAQCSVVVRSDGAILLQSGASNGTTLATYTGALTAATTWYQFEVEVIISNTAGGMRVRKLGNTSNDYDSFVSVGPVNTRAGTANSYANTLKIGAGTANQHTIDDPLWRSDSVANGVAWVGDVRCQTRRPASDASVQWTPAPATPTQTLSGGFSASAQNTTARLATYVVNYSGNITSITVVGNASMAGNVKAAIWADNAGVPGAVLGSSASQTAVAAGNNVCPLITPVAVTAGQRIWVGGLCDTTVGTWAVGTSGTNGGTISASFATFPQANPVMTTPSQPINSAIAFTLPGNWGQVAEATQDGATSYVYSSTVGQSDLYGISSIATTPASIVAVTTRAFLQKSDAGTRNTSVRLRSGGVNADSASAALNTVWGWQYVTNTTDPATGAAWTAVGVNNCSVGVVVTA